MDLVALADFNAVATSGGFAAASRAIGVPKATLSRRIRALEAKLDTRLFERGGRELRLTEEGLVLHRRIGPLLAELTQSGEEISGRSSVPRGRLRVSVPVLLANLAIGRIAAGFVAAFPEIDLEIIAEDRAVDPVADGFDVVIRANPVADTALVGHRILKDTLIVAAHPAIIPPKSISRQGTDDGFPAVLLTGAPWMDLWELVTDEGPVEIRPRPRLRVSSMSLAHQAVLHGAGAAILPMAITRPDIEAGRLNLWGRLQGHGAETWILYTSRWLQPMKVTAFVQFVREAFPGQHL
jgi:DNA-binding transcriptional LysR family regulator